MSAEVQEKWLKWVALTTTILAVCAAFGSMKSGGYSTQVQLTTTQEADRWSYYEAKGIKQHVSEAERDLLKLELLRADVPAVKADIQQKIDVLEASIARYDKEKAATKKEAEDIEKRQADMKRHGSNFSMCVMFIQISIMLSAIASLLKQRAAWLCGLAIGAVGIVYFLNGFFLFF